MIELTAGIAIAIMLWSFRKSFYAQADSFNEKVELVVKDSKVDLQEDYEELLKRIAETKAKQNGKWHTMTDVDSAMKSVTEAKSS